MAHGMLNHPRAQTIRDDSEVAIRLSNPGESNAIMIQLAFAMFCGLAPVLIARARLQSALINPFKRQTVRTRWRYAN
jgi:hypothetical protein